jgi:hypothetical protein
MADSQSAAVSAMRQREAAQDALEAEKMMFAHEVEADVEKWAGPDYNPKNIRALLAGFHVRNSYLLQRGVLLVESACGSMCCQASTALANRQPLFCVVVCRRYGRTTGGSRVVSRSC